MGRIYRGLEALNYWTNLMISGYNLGEVKNFSNAFRDGRVFCAILHRFAPDEINFDKLEAGNILENNKLAFRVALEKFGICDLLDPNDMIEGKCVDDKCIILYLSTIFHCLKNINPVIGVDYSQFKLPSDMKLRPKLAIKLTNRHRNIKINTECQLCGDSVPSHHEVLLDNNRIQHSYCSNGNCSKPLWKQRQHGSQLFSSGTKPLRGFNMFCRVKETSYDCNYRIRTIPLRKLALELDVDEYRTFLQRRIDSPRICLDQPPAAANATMSRSVSVDTRQKDESVERRRQFFATAPSPTPVPSLSSQQKQAIALDRSRRRTTQITRSHNYAAGAGHCGFQAVSDGKKNFLDTDWWLPRATMSSASLPSTDVRFNQEELIYPRPQRFSVVNNDKGDGKTQKLAPLCVDEVTENHDVENDLHLTPRMGRSAKQSPKLPARPPPSPQLLHSHADVASHKHQHHNLVTKRSLSSSVALIGSKSALEMELEGAQLNYLAKQVVAGGFPMKQHRQQNRGTINV